MTSKSGRHLIHQEIPAGLLRQLGLVSATALVVSNMIGTGIFTTSGFLVRDLGDAKLLLLIWVVGAVVALTGAFCYSELGVNFPSSGGEYVYLTQAFGPVWGFMGGWISFVAGFSAPIAAAALACSEYLGYFSPAFKQENATLVLGPPWFEVRLGGAHVLACALIGVLTLLNLFGVRRVAAVQNVLTSVKVLVILAFLILGFSAGSGTWDHFSTTATRESTASIPAAFAFGLFFIYLSYSGWNAATYVAEEVKQPARTLPLALTLGTLIVATLYVALNALFVYSAPLESLKGVPAIGSFAASRLFGPGIAGTFSALMALSLVSTVNAMVTIGPRVYYAMAKNGAFFSVAAKVHERWRTPVPAILMQGAGAMLITLTPFASLLAFIGFTLNFFAAMAVASLFVFRRRPGWQRLRVVSFAFPLIPALFMVVAAWTIVFGSMQTPRVSLAAMLTVVTGALLYRRKLKTRAPEVSGV